MKKFNKILKINYLLKIKHLVMYYVILLKIIKNFGKVNLLFQIYNILKNQVLLNINKVLNYFNKVNQDKKLRRYKKKVKIIIVIC